MSNGGDQIRKLMESFDQATTVKEDWGSSDWYSVIESMDKYIDKYGLSPDRIREAARNAAEFWGDAMGHDMNTRDGEQDAIEDCIGGWMRMSERGKKLQKMFAPRESIEEEDHDDAEYEAFMDVDADGEVYVVISAGGHQIAEMNYDTWKALVANIKSAMRSRM